MEFMKIIKSDLYYDRAVKKLKFQFPWLNGKLCDYEVEWNKGLKEPYVLVMNCFINNTLEKKEWYEYFKGKWNYVGYWTREDCVRYYFQQAWEKNKGDFPSFQDYINYRIKGGNLESDEVYARRLPDAYFSMYHAGMVRK